MQQPTTQIATPWTMLMTGIIVTSFSNDICIIFVHHLSQQIYKSHPYYFQIICEFHEYYYPNFHKIYDFFVCFLKFPIFQNIFFISYWKIIPIHNESQILDLTKLFQNFKFVLQLGLKAQNYLSIVCNYVPPFLLCYHKIIN